MTIKDEILEKLRAFRPLSEIKDECRSMSGMYAAMKEFLGESEEVLENRRRNLVESERELRGIQADLKRERSEREQIVEEVVRQEQRGKELAREIKDMSEEIAQLKAEESKFREHGFTPEILKMIAVIKDRSGPQLLAQMKTAEEYLQIEKEMCTLKELKARLNKEVQSLGAREKEISSKILSEKNRFDELKLRITAFKEAVAVVSSLFSRGYTTEDLRSLRYCLDMLAIEGDPRTSVARLLSGLKRQKSLLILQDQLTAKKAEILRLNKAIVDVKADLKVTRKIKNAFEEIEEAGKKAITETAEAAKAGIAYQRTAFESHVKDAVKTFEDEVSAVVEEIRRNLDQWGELREQKGKLQDLLWPGQVFFGVLHSTDYLEKIPLSIVVQLLERIHLWSEMNLPDVSVPLSQEILNELLDIQIRQRFKPTVMIELALAGFREIIIQETKKRHVNDSGR